jgi:hypothetical protein
LLEEAEERKSGRPGDAGNAGSSDDAGVGADGGDSVAKNTEHLPLLGVAWPDYDPYPDHRITIKGDVRVYEVTDPNVAAVDAKVDGMVIFKIYF